MKKIFYRSYALVLAMLVVSCPVLWAEESRDHVYPKALEPAENYMKQGILHQGSGRNTLALRQYFEAIEFLSTVKSDNPYVLKAKEDLKKDIQSCIGKMKEVQEKKGLIPYRGRWYKFEDLEKALKKEAERKKRQERWDQDERRARQERQQQQEQRRLYEEQRARQDFLFQQEQRRANEERRRQYELRQLREQQSK